MKYKILILSVFAVVIVYFAVFHVNIASGRQISPVKTSTDDVHVRIIHEVKPKSIKDYGREISGKEWDGFNYIISHESSWKHKAQNPNSSAYGLGQFLNSTWSLVGCEKTSDPYKQLDCAKKYMVQRYGSITKAQAFWKAHQWY